MRIIFIPGFGEDETIFSKITPFIPGDHIILNSWQLTANAPNPAIDVLRIANQLIDRYQITKEDVVIGHSMGGWIAYHIKHLINCPIIQIASWTNSDRLILPFSNSALMYWGIKSGLFFNFFVKWISIWLSYRNKPSREIFSYVFDLLKKGNKNNILNQLRIILRPVKETISVQPDLRIHSKKDTIVKPLAEPFYEVPGDHFTLYTYPEKVSAPILAFLKSKQS